GWECEDVARTRATFVPKTETQTRAKKGARTAVWPQPGGAEQNKRHTRGWTDSAPRRTTKSVWWQKRAALRRRRDRRDDDGWMARWIVWIAFGGWPRSLHSQHLAPEYNTQTTGAIINSRIAPIVAANATCREAAVVVQLGAKQSKHTPTDSRLLRRRQRQS